MKVKVKKLHPNATIPFKSYNRDFCYDVIATSREQVAPNVYRYGIGLAFEIAKESLDEFDDNIRLSIDLRPRSSVWKTGMILSNCQGTIDELYRGEVMAVFYHINPDLPKYDVGDKIGQIKIGITSTIEFEEASELSSTERGEGRYGSTGN